MTCEELRPDYVSYALGVADDPERTEIEEHLARECRNCCPGVASANGTVAAMAGAVPLAEPPRRLRRNIVAAVERESSRGSIWTLLPWAIAVALAVVVITMGITGRRESADTARLQEALSILNDPAARDVSFGEAQKPSRGRVVVSPSKGIVFIGASLPVIDASKTFELWVIPAKGNPIPAGLFQSRSDATAVYIHPGPIENAAAIAVTVEPAGGSEQPTTTPFIVTKL